MNDLWEVKDVRVVSGDLTPDAIREYLQGAIDLRDAIATHMSFQSRPAVDAIVSDHLRGLGWPVEELR